MTRSRVLTAAAAAALLLTSCIEFDEQVLTYRYDRDSDTLLLYQEYYGVFADAADSAGEPSAQEVEQLQAVLHGERTFFFDNFLLGLNSRTLWPDAERPEATITDPMDRLWAPAARVLAPNLTISAGPVFRDATGRLSGVQRVEIRHASAVVHALNRFLSGTCALEAQNENNTAPDMAAFARCAAASEMLAIDASGRLVLHVPIEVNSEAHAACDPKDCPVSDLAKLSTFIVEAGGSCEKASDSITIQFGQSGSSVHSLKHHVATHTYEPNLTGWVEHHWGAASAFDVEADRRSFLTPVPASPP